MKKGLYFTIILIGLFLLASALPIQKNVNAATATPPTYPPFPTATVYPPSSEANNVFVNEESGFSIKIPNKVKATNSSPDSGNFQEYEVGNAEIFGYLYPANMQSGDTLQEVGESNRDLQTGGLEQIIYVTDKEITLSNGIKAWYSQFQGYYSAGKYSLEVRLITVQNFDHAVVLMFFSLPEYFLPWTSTLNEMRDSIQLSIPTVMGFPRNEVLILEGGENKNPRENDPATAHSAGDELVFNGLVSYNDKLEIIPELATGWDVSSDGTIYTFHLQPNAVFHNGKPVTADDVIYSLERAADPATNSDTVMTYLSDIVGLKEKHEGNAESISGLKVVDEHTLQVTIDAPKPYFLLKLTYPTAYVLDRQNVESGEEWYRTPNGTGPYRLVRWDSMEKKVYQRFEDYYGTKPAIPNIIFTLYTGEGIRLYETGAIDITGIGSYNVQRVTDPSDPLNKELMSGVDLCTSFVQFDVTQPPFDDVKVRQAFSMAFDRNKYIEVVLSGAALPAKGIYPPALPGYNLELKGLEYNPEKARQLLKESKYGSAEGLPEIIYTDGGYGSYLNAEVAALSQMWEQNLGVSITVQNLEPEKMMDEIAIGNHGQIISSGWCADYPDPENFADVLFHSGKDMNYGKYSNPTLDTLLEQARVEPDVSKRIGMYQQAEQIIVDDAPAIFLTHSISYVLVKPYIKGYILSPVSTFPGIRLLWMDDSYWK
jgi:oligopeptide transport system substrate-binding protein